MTVIYKSSFTYLKFFNLLFEKQNCKKIAESHLFYLAPLLKNAEFEDQGYYSCVFSLRHDGKLYSITKTLNVTVVKGKRSP